MFSPRLGSDESSSRRGKDARYWRQQTETLSTLMVDLNAAFNVIDALDYARLCLVLV